MSNQKKKIEELLMELSELDRKSGLQARKLEVDEHGTILLDPNNPDDVEWYENDEAYDIIKD